MRAFVHGGVRRAVAGAIGTWDPFVPAHRELVRELVAHAHARSLDAVAVALDPSPVLYVHGRSSYPVYDDFRARVRLLLNAGLDGVVRVAFARRDVEAGAAEVFDAVEATGVRMNELWLGATQSLGVGERGNHRTIQRLAKERRMQIEFLAQTRLPTTGVRELLKEGRIAEAIELVGHPPLRTRPAASRVRLAWRPGHYLARPMDSWEAPDLNRLIGIDLRAKANGMACFDWPDRRIGCVGFVAGPADERIRGRVGGLGEGKSASTEAV